MPLPPRLPAPSPRSASFPSTCAKLNYEQLGKASREIGFGGAPTSRSVPAATCCPTRHRGPASRRRRPPRCRPDGADDHHRPDIAQRPRRTPPPSTAGRLGIPLYKPGYWHYKPDVDVNQTIAQVKRDAAGLVAIGQEHKVAAGLHNHSGDYVGTATWDTRDILSGLDPRWAGYYFDPCHATIEGGAYGWLLSTRIALANLKMVAIKDSYWAKKNGKWSIAYCPLGEGMVDWPKFFRMLAASGFTGPLTLHVEYDPPDEPAAIARDLEFLRKQVDAAYV